MKKFLQHIILILVLITSIAFGQDQPEAYFVGKIDEQLNNAKKIPGVKVELFQDGKPLKTKVTSSNGKYTISGPFGHVYTIKFSKAGYVSKKLEFDLTKKVNEEDALQTYDIKLNLSLFENHPDVDFSPVENIPIGKAEFDTKSGEVQFDSKYNAKARKTLMALLDKKLELEEAEKNNAANEAKKLAEQEKKFNELVAAGDKANGSSDFTTAVAKYEEALKIKTDGPTKTKLDAAKQKMADAANAAKAEEEFNKLMAEGNKAMQEKDYAFAKTKFQEAKAKNPSHADPPKKIAEAQAKIDEFAAQEQKFNELLAKGNSDVDAQKFDEGISKFTEALKIKPGDDDATKALENAKKLKQEAEDAANAEAKKKEDYEKLISQADADFKSDKLDEAEKAYNDALALFSDEQHPKGQLEAIKTRRDELAEEQAKADAEAEKRKKYDDLIASGDIDFSAAKLDEAEKAFKDALAIYPDEQHPKDQLEAIVTKRKEIADNAEKEKEAQKRQEYEDLMSLADSDFNAEKLDAAEQGYNDALGLYPDEQQPKDQLEAIKAKRQELADAKANEEAEAAKRQEYEDLIALADSDFGADKLDEAEKSYNDALALYSDEQHPKDQLEAIKTKRQELADEEAEAAKRTQYEELIAKADGEFNADNLDDAEKSYNDALALYSDEQHPKDQLEAIKTKRQELANEKANKEAEAEKRTQYEELITKADGEFNADNLDDAEKSYNDALALYANEQHPKDQLEAIKTKRQELADAKADEEAEAAKRTQYEELIAKADGEFNSDNLDDAEKSYNDALALYSEEQHPKDQLEAIKTKREEIAANQSAAEEAAAEAAKRTQYEKLITKADGEFNADNLDDAEKSYNDALTLYSDEQHPKDQLEAIKAKRDEIAANQSAAEAAAAEAAKRTQYEGLIAKADGEFNADNLDDAEKSYNDAIALYSDEQHPKDQLEAIKAKRDEIAANQSAAEAAAAEAAKRAQYEKLITKADAGFNADNLDSAEKSYNDALALYSDEQHPKDQLEAIKAKRDEIAANQSAVKAAEAEAVKKAAEEAAKLLKYDNLIAKADSQRDSEDYSNAKKTYEEAYNLINKDYPQEQINVINEKLEANSKNELAEKEYNKRIKIADQNLTDGDLDGAKAMYNAAKNFNKDATYPDEQLNKIKEIEEAASAKESEYNNLIAKADKAYEKQKWNDALKSYKTAKNIFNKPHPNERINTINNKLKEIADANESANAAAENKRKYDELIAKADGDFDTRKYAEAKENYKKAYNLINEDYPQKKINEINNLLERETKEVDMMKQYNKIVAAADKAFESKVYNEARDLYKRAKSLNSSDKYASDQLREIDRILDDLANTEKNKARDAKYQELISKADNQFASKNYNNAKKTYKEAFDLKSENYPQDQINKINDLMKSERDKEIDRQYQKIIAQADKDFDAETFESAKSYYKRAAGLKPTDPYPKKRLQEITELLSPDGAEPYYGDLIGDISVMDAAALLTDTEDKSFERKVDSTKIKEEKWAASEKALTDGADYKRIATSEKWVGYMDEVYDSAPENDEIRKENVLDAEELTDEKYASEKILDKGSEEKRADQRKNVLEVEEKILAQQLASDDPRKQNIVDAEELTDEKYASEKILDKGSEEKRADQRKNVLEVEEKILAQQLASDDPRKENIVDAEKYTDEKYASEKLLDKGSEEKRSDQRKNVLEVEEKILAQQLASDDPRKQNIIDAEKYTDEKYASEKLLDKGSEEKRVDQREKVIDVEEKILAQQLGSDDPRKQNIVDAEKYTDEKYASEKLLDKGSEEKRADQRKNALEVEEKILAQQLASDDPRKQNIVDAEKYTDEKYASKKALDNGNGDKRFENRQKYKDVEEEIRAEQKINDNPRQENIKDSEELTDKKYASDKLLGKDNSEKRFENRDEYKDVEDEIRAEQKSNDNPRQENIKNSEELTDDKYTADKALGKKNEDKIYDNHDFLENHLYSSPENYTAEFKNALARKYPEGLTAQNYTKKNRHGDVKEVVIRRIVVKNNIGNDYVCVVSKFGRTYYKNGVAIAEYTWRNETTGKNL